jgi:hypothetical protein
MERMVVVVVVAARETTGQNSMAKEKEEKIQILIKIYGLYFNEDCAGKRRKQKRKHMWVCAFSFSSQFSFPFFQ